jgi:lipoate-protein ligase B
VDGRTGVWVNGEKIASIGIGVRRWISWHGFALNVGVNLDYFSMINPCGLRGIRMTSMEKTLGSKVSMARVKQQLVQSFERVFQSRNAGRYEVKQA